MSLLVQRPKYQVLGLQELTENGLDEEKDGLLDGQEGSPPARLHLQSRWWFFIAIVSWVFTGLLTLLLAVNVYAQADHAANSFEHGWKTDFLPAHEAVSIQTTIFTGSPAFTDSGGSYIPNKDPTLYVGKPSPEIDHAWERLIEGRYFLVTEGEAKATWGSDYKSYWSADRGGYVAGLDVFHTLHCLNLIRQKFHPEYYPPRHGSPEHQATHDGHCIEQIRQYIMCAGDLTVLGTTFYPGLGDHGRNYVLSDVPHTCRNFDRIRAWTWDRYNGSTAVQPVLDKGQT